MSPRLTTNDVDDFYSSTAPGVCATPAASPLSLQASESLGLSHRNPGIEFFFKVHQPTLEVITNLIEHINSDLESDTIS